MLELKKDFLNKFGVEAYKQLPKSGQKRVYLITRNKRNEILKLIDNKDERLNREVQLEKKGYAGVPKILEEGSYEGMDFYIEEYLPNGNLEENIKKFSHNPVAIRILLLEMIDILEPIWNDKHVHRDLKPENIMFGCDNKVFIIDFGIAKSLSEKSLTKTGDMPKTLRFCSPEQYFGNKDLISYRTDIFNLGIIAYYLSSEGNLPFGQTPSEIAEYFDSHKESSELPFNLPSSLEDEPLKLFLGRSLKFKPTERYNRIALLRKSLK